MVRGKRIGDAGTGHAYEDPQLRILQRLDTVMVDGLPHVLTAAARTQTTSTQTKSTQTTSRQ